MAGRSLLLLLCALFAAPALAGDVAVYHQPLGTNVEVPATDAGRDSMCAYFERIDSATWRTESGAVLRAQRYDEATDDFDTVLVHIPPSNIEETHALDLFWSLEDACPHLEPAG